MRLTLYNAGHILGSAQIKIQKNGFSLLYTGDFRLEPSKTVETFEFVETDVLIMETTFGQAQYRMPSKQEVEDRLVERCRHLLTQNKIPIVLAYSLGSLKNFNRCRTASGGGRTDCPLCANLSKIWRRIWAV